MIFLSYKNSCCKGKSSREPWITDLNLDLRSCHVGQEGQKSEYTLLLYGGNEASCALECSCLLLMSTSNSTNNKVRPSLHLITIRIHSYLFSLTWLKTKKNRPSKPVKEQPYHTNKDDICTICQPTRHGS